MTDFDLKAFREKHSFSQTDLAELWDVTQNMISKFEQADTPPAIARYAAQALEEELTGEKPMNVDDVVKLRDRIAELEQELVDRPLREEPRAIEGDELDVYEARQRQKAAEKARDEMKAKLDAILDKSEPQPKRSRGLGRPKSADRRD